MSYFRGLQHRRPYRSVMNDSVENRKYRFLDQPGESLSIFFVVVVSLAFVILSKSFVDRFIMFAGCIFLLDAVVKFTAPSWPKQRK